MPSYTNTTSALNTEVNSSCEPFVNQTLTLTASVEADEKGKDCGPFFTLKNLWLTFPLFLLASIYGFEIGLVGVYTALVSRAQTCELYKARTPCETLFAAKCLWKPATDSLPAMCVHKNGFECNVLHSTSSSCKTDSHCLWDSVNGVCCEPAGHNAIQNGLFASSMYIGSSFGSLLGGILTTKLNFRKTFFVLGCIALTGTSLQHVSTAILSFSLLIVARVILGFSIGWMMYVGPCYSGTFLTGEHKLTAKRFYQPGSVGGAFTCSIIGYILGATVHKSSERNAEMGYRLQGVVVLGSVYCLIVFLLSFVVHDDNTNGRLSDTDQTSCESNQDTTSDEQRETEKGKKQGNATVNKPHLTAMITPIIVGLSMSASLQGTGLTAVSSFGPEIMHNLNLDGLLGNLVVVSVFFAACPFIILVSRLTTPRNLFLITACSSSLVLIFVCGIPVYPGVVQSDTVVLVCGLIGISLFLASFVLGMGTHFYTLMTDIYPESFRSMGSSIALCGQSFFQLITTIGYPTVVEKLSGGVSADQRKGQSLSFIIFGCFGLFNFTLQYFLLHHWEGKEEDSNAEDTEERDTNALRRPED